MKTAENANRATMSRMNRLLGLPVLVLGLSIASAQAGSAAPAAGTAHVDDQMVCSNATLRGSYGLHATGTIIGVGDFAAVGRFVFDGRGHLTATLFVRANGDNSGPLQIVGTYSVGPECIVTDSWGGSTHVSVIVDNGRGYFILNNTVAEGDTISGEARRQDGGRNEQ